MPDKVITSIDQVTKAWLNSVFRESGALINGAVAMFDMQAGQGNWSMNVKLNIKYRHESQGALPQRLFLKMVNADLEDGFFNPSEVYYYRRDFMELNGLHLFTAMMQRFQRNFSGTMCCWTTYPRPILRQKKKRPHLNMG